jgi:hypothetical protein
MSALVSWKPVKDEPAVEVGVDNFSDEAADAHRFAAVDSAPSGIECTQRILKSTC